MILKIILAIVAAALLAALIALICEAARKPGFHRPFGPYERFFKRPLDAFFATGALIVFSPILLILTVLGAVNMKGNPFYIQSRPGRRDPKTGKETTIRLMKFRSMTNAKDAQGNLLPHKERLNRYGRLIRASSLDELPSLVNIIKGDIAVIGPRPLATIYLDYYTEEERHRHDVRPGLTGLAQANGRNNLSWEEKFAYDLQYVNRITLAGDVGIILKTVRKVLKHEGIGQGEELGESLHIERANWIHTDKGAVKPKEETT